VAEALPFHNLGTLRVKIKRALARKYLAEGRHGLTLTHDALEGRIAADGLVIDGKQIEWEKLKSIFLPMKDFRFISS
jgi:hypothetical protein